MIPAIFWKHFQKDDRDHGSFAALIKGSAATTSVRLDVI